MTEDSDLEQRLRSFGQVPVDPELAATHTSAMTEARSHSPAHGSRFSWRAVAAAAVVGFLAGSTGLAAAGTLPDPAQDVAHNVLGAVGIDVPRSTEGCPDGRSYRNHGEYVSEVEAAGGDVTTAARSQCGKPAHSNGKGPNGKGPNGEGPQDKGPRVDTDGDPCTGPPPWAGRKLPKDERNALQDEHRRLCGADEGEAPELEDDAALDDAATDEKAPEPTTTAPAETTTTATPETTETTAADSSTTDTTTG